jgi:mono/diheme cytochrome c family protein
METHLNQKSNLLDEEALPIMKHQTLSLSRLTHAFISIGALLLLLAGTFTLAQAEPPRQDAANGEAIFKAKCTACHTVGGGKLVGPDLKGVTTRRDIAWLSGWIKAPDKVLASGDPIAAKLLTENNNIPMPNLALSDADVADLIAYFQSVDGASASSSAPTQAGAASTQAAAPTQAGSAPTQAAASTAQPVNQPLAGMALVLAMKGDPDYGEKLFTGEIPLANGGTACIACHSVESVGIVGGGALGPDQTHVYTRYGGDAGLAGVLATLPFPTMQGIFANKLLTEDEQADLRAFFARADGQGEPRTQLNLQVILGAGSGVTLILLIGMLFFWPRQRLSLAQRLRKNGKL